MSKKYDDVLMIKLPKDLKNKVAIQANLKCKNISEYIRDLIVKDINEV